MKNPYLNLIKTLWHYGAKWRSTIVVYYLAFILAEGFLSFTPFAFGQTINVLQHFTAERLNEVIFWLSFGVGLLLLFWFLHGPARIIERKTALKIQQTFRLNLYQQLLRLPLKWHQDHHSGNIISRINRSTTALHRFAESGFIYIEAITKFLTCIGFLLWISLPIGLISFIFSVVIMATVILFDRKLIPLYDAQNEIENHVGAVLFDYISNMTTILTLRLGTLTHSNLLQRLLTIWPFFKKDVLINEAKWFTMMILLSIVNAAILIGYIIYSLKTTDVVLIGVVVMIFRYQWELGAVFHDLSVNYSELVRMNTDVKGIQPLLEDIQKFASPLQVTSPRPWIHIEIKDLVFHHDKEERGQIFNGIDFHIQRGEKIALIGQSGGGKSTLLNLLSGLYLPTHVKLKMDDLTFENLIPLQAITSLIPQDPEIFENTIAFNIALDLPTTSEEIHQAVKLAGFENVLATLPKGLATDIREKGLNLSVGQKQRLALARGLFAARLSSLILMDEPTSSVDLPTEKEILSGILCSFTDAAMIVSLHRLHLLPQFDSIIMLENGKVLAYGPTNILLNQSGPVRDLWLDYHS